MKFKLTAIVILILTLAGAALAQSSRGVLRGKVVDSRGAAVRKCAAVDAQMYSANPKSGSVAGAWPALARRATMSAFMARMMREAVVSHRHGTIAWTTVADTVRTTSAAIAAGHQPAQPPAQLAAHALATGFSRGFLTAAATALLALLTAIATIRVSRQELTGAAPAPHEPAPPPATVQQHQDRAALAAAARPCRYC